MVRRGVPHFVVEPRRRRRVLVRSSRRRTPSKRYRAGRDKTYRREVRTLLAARGWRVNVHGNQELGAVPPDGWPHVATILERSKNSSKASIRTITGANGVVRYLELVAHGATDVVPEVEPSAAEVASITPPVWKFAAQAGSLLDPVY